MKTRYYKIGDLVIGPNANPYYVIGIGFRQFEVENLWTKKKEVYPHDIFTLWFG